METLCQHPQPVTPSGKSGTRNTVESGEGRLIVGLLTGLTAAMLLSPTSHPHLTQMLCLHVTCELSCHLFDYPPTSFPG